ncbi:MAG: hypothetical protein KJO07_16310 [Deltaproteobacteria bacterium]|jgi:hypothetical protein|nr:hypothetical protein [Deltaproteobacteria bacterium]
MHRVRQFMTSQALDVSVIIPFGDDEDVIGRAVKRLAEHLRELGCSFELLLADEDSRDNSHSLLGLLRGDIPELRLLVAPGRGRGIEIGADSARGQVLWLLTPQAALQTLSPFGGAYRRVSTGDLDLMVVEGRYSVARRTQVHGLLTGMRGGPGIHERLAKRASSKLKVERHGLAGGAVNRNDSPWARILETGPLRVALGWIDSES